MRNTLRYFTSFLAICLLAGCYDITKETNISEVAIAEQQLVGSFSIKMTNEERTLKSIDVFSGATLSNITVKVVGTEDWKPINDIEVFMSNGQTTQFELMADVSLQHDLLAYHITNFELEDTNGEISSDQKVLEYQIPAYHVNSLFDAYSIHESIGSAESVATADINADGLIDIVATYRDSAYLFLQDENGQQVLTREFTLSKQLPEDLLIEDINSDGRLDIIVASYAAGIDVFTQTEGFEFTQTLISTRNSLAVKTGDFNSDGLTDIASIGFTTEQLEIRYQSEPGEFTDMEIIDVEYGGYNDMDIGDINGDGKDDIIVMSGQTSSIPPFSVIYQLESSMGEPEYYDHGYQQNAHGISVGDLNNDGWQDVAVSYGWYTDEETGVAIFYGDGEGGLQDHVSFTSERGPSTTVISDINGDGRDDVTVFNAGASSISTYIQQHDGVLRAQVIYDLPYSTNSNRSAISVNDVNNDGKTDLVIASSQDGLVILNGRH